MIRINTYTHILLLLFVGLFSATSNAEKVVSKEDFELLTKNLVYRLTAYVGDNKKRYGSVITQSDNECTFEGYFYFNEFIDGEWEEQYRNTIIVNLKDLKRDMGVISKSSTPSQPFFNFSTDSDLKFKMSSHYSQRMKKKDHYLNRDRVKEVDNFQFYTTSKKEAESMARQLPLMIDYCRAKQS